MTNGCRTALRVCVALAASTLMPPTAGAQYDFTNFQFAVEDLGHGAYGLLAPSPGVTNGGFIVGDEAVLVVDAHLTPGNAAKIIAAVRSVTQLPIRFLVNTNFHADHTFGNYVFPDETIIVAHSRTPRLMVGAFEQERGFFAQAIVDGTAQLEPVQLRLPDITFTDRTSLELGNKTVELHYFGRGNSPGDIIVYDPDSKTAWTGNMIIGRGVSGWVNTDLPNTLARVLTELDIETIVPGHGSGGENSLMGPEVIGESMRFAATLIVRVQAALRQGLTPAEVVASLPLTDMPPPQGLDGWREFIPGTHRQNIERVYRELGGNGDG